MNEHLDDPAGRDTTPRSWPPEFEARPDGRVDEGLTVWSLSGEIEGRTTGARIPCKSTGCPGWLIGVRWESGQYLQICSEGWRFDPSRREVRVTGGGEISARFVSPAPLGTPPNPRVDWPARDTLRRYLGWRVGRDRRTS